MPPSATHSDVRLSVTPRLSAATVPLAGQASLASGPSVLPRSSVKLTSTMTFLPSSAPVRV